jgi:dipeptidyl aminopeptidase/acylaminoacyl peptidase
VFRDDLPSDWIRRWVLVDHGTHAYDPAWSPDGERIVFVSEATGNDEIWVINADGSEEVQLTHNDWEWDKGPTWSPDGSMIAFWSNRVTGYKQIWVMNGDGSEQHNVSNNEYNDWQPLWIRPELIARVQDAIDAAKTQRASAAPTVIATVALPASQVAAVSTPTPTSPATPAATPGPDRVAVVHVDRANVREGPGPGYAIVTEVARGDRLEVTGSNPSGDWWEVRLSGDLKAWIWGETVTVE